MKTLVAALVFCGITSVSAAQPYQPAWESLDKRPMPAWFQDAKFGIFIHWGVYAVPSYAPVLPGKLAYSEWYWNALTGGKGPKPNPIQSGTWDYHRRQYGAEFDYRDFAPRFTADLFDADHWAEVFRRSGAKYVVPTSKHHEGFALWPSREASATWGRPWNAVEIGPKRDLLGELTKAVRTKGLRMGFYFSLYEWYNPLWLSDKARYVSEHLFPQFKDVVTRYEPSIIFSDGEWDLTSAEWRSPELLAWLFNESAVKDEVVVNDRWGKDSRHKHGGYWTTEYTPGMADTGHPWEESRGMGFSYGYNRAERLEHYRTGRELVTILVDIVSRGGNLLLDIGPDADGIIPVIMEQRLAEDRRVARRQRRGDLRHEAVRRARSSGARARCRRSTTARNTTRRTTCRSSPAPRRGARPRSKASSRRRGTVFTRSCRAGRVGSSRGRMRAR